MGRISKPQKEESKKIFAEILAPKQRRSPRSGYQANTKLSERVPFVTKEGMEIQIKEALPRKPGATLKVNDTVDDNIVVELEKEGFIDPFTNSGLLEIFRRGRDAISEKTADS